MLPIFYLFEISDVPTLTVFGSTFTLWRDLNAGGGQKRSGDKNFQILKKLFVSFRIIHVQKS